MATNSYRQAAAFRAALRAFLRRSEVIARDNEITPRQHLLMLQIAGTDSGHTTVSALVETLALTQSAVTELVQRAEQAGLVARAVSETDARVAHLSLTAKGQQKLHAVHEALGPERAHLREMIDTLDDA